MYRNLMNRWWTLTRAGVIGLVLLVAVPVQGLAISVTPESGNPNPGMPTDPGAPGAGDPDAPSNTGRSAPVLGRGPGKGSMRRAPGGPDAGWTTRSAWVFKIRIALHGVRLFYLHD
jgi:hypothetical protein